MFYSIRDDGICSGMITPKHGELIQDAICRELGVEGINETEFFNPKMLTAVDDKYEGMVMLGRLRHSPEERENIIANVLTCRPENKWCYGPYVLVYRRGGYLVAIPDNLRSRVLSLIMELSGSVTGYGLEEHEEPQNSGDADFMLELEKLRSEQYKTECEKWMHIADLGSAYIFRIKGATEKPEEEWTSATIHTVQDLVEEYITKREELKNE